MTQRFEKAINALYNAYFNGTLAKGTCLACAVGNIVADAQGDSVIKEDGQFDCERNNEWWYGLFCTSSQGQTINHEPILEETLLQLTGYTAQEMAKVEFAFETNTKILYYDYCKASEQEILEDQFNGLSAVFDVLLKLDGEDVTPVYKDKLKTHPGLVTA